MNVHDSERVAGLLEQAGYELTDKASDADLLVVNTCSVRERAQERLFSRLDRVSTESVDRQPVVAVIGCVAQQEGDRILKRAPGVNIVVGTQALKQLTMLIEEQRAASESQIDINPYDDVSFPLGIAIRNDPVKAFVTIIEGCNDFCTFCVVPYTRGHERMRPASEIVEEVRRVAAQGHKEIHLLGQIVNHYQAPDLAGCDFAGLLERVHAVSDIVRIRFASPHPRHVTQGMLTMMARLPKVCRHLHLPVQSGSTVVLNSMRRRHTREEYLDLVDCARETIRDVTLSTDMIVGFPGETEAQFEETLSLTSRVRYHSMFSFKYSERPNTLAASRFPDTVSEADKTRRLMTLQSLQKGIQSTLHNDQIGKTIEVLADSHSRRRQYELSGRSSGNTVVNFPGHQGLIGHLVNVRIHRAGPNSLWGELESRHAG